ncbi:TetR/AcrR family transcriptional regulator [Aggregatilineales bacterium SYSU G02658]
MARKPASLSVSRETILLAAADVLRQNGYESTTMKDIAARVNLTAASLYHHFKNKDFLLLEVLRLGLDHAIQQMTPIVASELPAREKLARMIITHIVEVTNNTAVGAAMVFEIRALMNARTTNGQLQPEDAARFIAERDAFFQQRDAFEKLFRNTIREGIERGEFRAVDASIVAKAMLGAQNWVGVWYRETGRLKGEDIARIMADTFLASLIVAEPSMS